MELDQLGNRLASGLARVAVAIQVSGDSIDDGVDGGVERTVAHQLVLLLLNRRQHVFTVHELATELGMSEPDTLAAVGTLARAGLVTIGPAPSYSPQGVRVTLTERGRAESPELLNWAAELLAEVDRLDEENQRRLFAVVVERIAAMQRAGQIPVTRMCVTCRFFGPFAHPGTSTPHHCHLVDAPFGHRALRLRCPDQEPLIRDVVT